MKGRWWSAKDVGEVGLWEGGKALQAEFLNKRHCSRQELESRAVQCGSH